MNRYPATLTPAEDGSVVAQAVDLPEALTFGSDAAEALRELEDALVVALVGYVEGQRELPRPSTPAAGQPVVVVPALVAAKLALYQAMREAGVNNVQLARRLGVSETVVRRLLAPDHHSKIEKVDEALAALGRRLVVQVEAA